MKKENNLNANEIVATRLEQLLARKGIKQADLARICQVSPQAVYKWFRGNKRGKISKESALKISKSLDVSIEWLFGDDTYPSPSENEKKGLKLLTEHESELIDIFRSLPESEASKFFEEIQGVKIHYDKILNELMAKRGIKKI
ncbi:helix-turn-helix transcriptional regulator [Candidatus Arsenophonus triatominarum]|uniref:helix-turn-helix transcriptional regulator n=1 Tax=Candidatus Arsenophonus triatominarum TaxID=57911 RepID=UPI0007C45A52|nr:helix-turn-helix domain-containing protein [Candidatus Arsenophonus triatominarum]